MKTYKMTFDDLRKCGYEGSDTDSGLRFVNDEKISKPEKADAIIIPLSPRETDQLTPKLWVDINEKFGKKYNIDEERFVSFDVSDFEFQTDKFVNGSFIRSSAKGWYVRKMPRTISLSWPVENFSDCCEVPKEGFKYKIGFRGWLSSNTRVNAVGSCFKEFGPEMDHYTTNEFYGYIERDRPADAKIRKELFKLSLKNCLLQLTPASIWHVFPYRFFEAMSAARVPVLFCHDYILPWVGEKVDWNKCAVFFDTQQSHLAGPLIREWLSHHTDEEVVEMGKYGRHVWEKWLNRDKWPLICEMAVEEQLKKDKLLG